MRPVLLKVAVFSPVRQYFLYRPPNGLAAEEVPAGVRVAVPFGRSARVGLVVGVAEQTEPSNRSYKAVTDVIDDEPILDRDERELVDWAARYYHHPIGEVYATMLPGLLRRGKSYRPAVRYEWALAVARHAIDIPKRAVRQREIVSFLAAGPRSEDDFADFEFDWRRIVAALSRQGWVTRREVDASEGAPVPEPDETTGVDLNAEQRAAVDAIVAAKERFQPFLLYGVTGSGKTDVYMEVIEDVLAAGRQALVLLPEIALTQHLVERFERRFRGCVQTMHSGLSERQRMQVWYGCRSGEVKILLGTRSAVWTRFPNLGCLIVDEEHDPSFKQQEGFRYNARDVAVVRASKHGVPIVLGTATPSFESYRNAETGKYELLRLTPRAGGASLPLVQCIDLRGMSMTGGLSEPLTRAIEQRLASGEQTLLFLNRRGYAPIVLCHSCGATVRCDRCDANMVYHREKDMVICHQCEKALRLASYPTCCAQTEWIHLGQGTEQLEENIEKRFPDARIERIDRDTVRKKAELDRIFGEVKRGAVDILLGTQMLAKGHDFSRVTLVGIIDADSRLFSLDFRAEERLAQLIIQVAGRAGRAEKKGEVLIQTHQPNHWLLRTIIGGDYTRFMNRGLEERRDAALPPYTYTALLRAEAVKFESTVDFLSKVHDRAAAAAVAGVEISPPVPSTIERRAGKYRAEILFTAERRDLLAKCLSQVVEYASQLPEKSRVRWALDIDPQDF